MTAFDRPVPARANLRSWLTADVATSSWHARLQRAYFGWRRLCGNRLTMLGLAVLLFLVAIAALAPLIAPEDLCRDCPGIDGLARRPVFSEWIFLSHGESSFRMVVAWRRARSASLA